MIIVKKKYNWALDFKPGKVFECTEPGFSSGIVYKILKTIRINDGIICKFKVYVTDKQYFYVTKKNKRFFKFI